MIAALQDLMTVITLIVTLRHRFLAEFMDNLIAQQMMPRLLTYQFHTITFSQASMKTNVYATVRHWVDSLALIHSRCLTVISTKVQVLVIRPW